MHPSPQFSYQPTSYNPPPHSHHPTVNAPQHPECCGARTALEREPPARGEAIDIHVNRDLVLQIKEGRAIQMAEIFLNDPRKTDTNESDNLMSHF